MKFVIQFVACVFITGSSHAYADFVFSDNTFANADWTASKVFDSTVGQTATFSAQQQLSGGNPTAFRQTILNYDYSGSGNSEGIIVAHIRNSWEYSPLLQGPIQSIGISYNAITLSQSGGTPDALVRLLARQDGVLYSAALAPILSSTWVDRSFSNLTSSNFQRLGTSGALNPDFTINGSALTFGYGVSTASAGSPFPTTLAIASGLDNLNISITSVPEPSSLVLLSVVLAGAIGVRRRSCLKPLRNNALQPSSRSRRAY